MIPWWWVPIIVLLDNSFVGRFIRRLGARSGEATGDAIARVAMRRRRRREERGGKAVVDR
jgi:hypothetical protein